MRKCSSRRYQRRLEATFSPSDSRWFRGRVKHSNLHVKNSPLTSLRASFLIGAFRHRSQRKMKARQAVIDDTTDSENLADFAGCAIAHAAYASLPARQRKLTLPGLNLTAEHLFFVGHCAKWCENMRQTAARYAPGRSRCIVPLMNMVEFSDVFGCAPGTPMNPPKKCAFWS